jgi:heme exporter protein A
LQAADLELWRGERRLFARLGIDVRAGQVAHVTGPNGIGKSSLLRVLSGLTRPETGSVRWQGQPVLDDPDAFFSALSYLGHRDGLKNDLSAIENLQFAQALRPDAGRDDTASIVRCLEEVGLSAVAALPVRALSAGQRRRVAIARSLLSDASLWILDEPFSNLDVAGREWGHACVARHLDNGGLAVITSHHPLTVPGHTAIELALA